MKIIRWLISNFFLILLIVAVIYGYMFWGNLTGKDTPVGEAVAYLSKEFKSVDSFVTAVKEKQAKLSSEREETEADKPAVTAVHETDKPEMGKPETAGNEAAASTSLQSSPVTISYSHNKTQVRQRSDGLMDTSAEKMTEKPAASANDTTTANVIAEPVAVAAEQSVPPVIEKGDAAKADHHFVPDEVAKQLDNVDDHGRVIDSSMQSDDVRSTWIKARKSFYQRKYEQSEQAYLKVIGDTEDNFDAYGELGNVYFNQGKKAQAAEAYYQAASILVRKGQVQRVKSLMGLMRHLDKSKAEELQKLIDAAQKKAA
jgi:tetratricopeptide (TPR) repeat protein